MTIYKYPLDSIITMPKGSQVLPNVMLQNDRAHIWAIVDENETEVEHKHFASIGTGGKISGDLGMYIGSVQHELENGTYEVYHIFEKV